MKKRETRVAMNRIVESDGKIISDYPSPKYHPSCESKASSNPRTVDSEQGEEESSKLR